MTLSTKVTWRNAERGSVNYYLSAFRRDLNLDRNYTVISRLEEEIRQKDSIIRDQSDTINHYRSVFVNAVNLFSAVYTPPFIYKSTV